MTPVDNKTENTSSHEMPAAPTKLLQIADATTAVASFVWRKFQDISAKWSDSGKSAAPAVDVSTSRTDEGYVLLEFGKLKDAQTEEAYARLLNAYLGESKEIVKPIFQEDFLKEAHGKTSLSEHKKTIIKDLNRKLPVFFEGKDIRLQGIKEESDIDKILTGEKAQFASLLHQGVFLGNFVDCAGDFFNDLGICLMQVTPDELKQLVEKMYTTSQERDHFLEESFKLSVDLDKNHQIVLNSKQIVKVASTEKVFAYLIIHTHYEQERLVRNLIKLNF